MSVKLNAILFCMFLVSCGTNIDNDEFLTSLGGCDDFDASIYPGAEELCDNIDNDCDGMTDENFTMMLWYPDNDGDGYAATYDPSHAIESCVRPTGTVLYGDYEIDCNDTDSTINPHNEEVCDDEIDNDCNGDVDEYCASF